MKARVALINPRKGWRPPLGLLYVAAALKGAGYEVRVFEFSDEAFSRRKNERLWRQLTEFSPRYVGFGVISWNRRTVSEMISRLRRELPDAAVICGGKDPTFEPEVYVLEFGADVVVIGEGEETIVELLDRMDTGGAIESVAGIAYPGPEGMIARTPERKPVSTVEARFPEFDLVDYEHYTNIRLGGIPGHYIKTGFMMANRGCPFTCKFCSDPIRNVYRKRSVENIVAEMKWQKERFGIKGMVFLDDLFAFNRETMEKLCREIIREKLNLKLYAQTRVDVVSSDEILALMKRAGFIQLALGLESGSPRILEKMNKKTSLDQAKRAVAAVKGAGIEVYAFLIVGLPGETVADLELTVKLLKEVRPTYVTVNYFMPMPGTRFFDEWRGDAMDLSFSLSDKPMMNDLVSTETLMEYRGRFLGLAEKSANLNLFRYPAFYLFLMEVSMWRVDVLIRGLLLQRNTKMFVSYFEAMRTAMINHRICC